MNDALLEKERDQLANALERLADVQRELAEGQRSLMTGRSPSFALQLLSHSTLSTGIISITITRHSS